MAEKNEPKTIIIAETENFLAWEATEPDEITYHLDVNNATLHFFKEEWDEFVDLMRTVLKEKNN